MKELLEQFKVRQPAPVSGQIQDHVRELILSGKLTPGERLPSTEELAQSWDTHVPTVHKALTNLVAEGILERHHGKGTFVRHREEKLTCVGIYHTQENWTKGSSDFNRAVHAALAEQLDQLGIRTRVWIDSRPKTERDTPWDELLRAVKHREIQGLICLQGGWPAVHCLNKLPIPSVFLSSANIPNRVVADPRQFVDQLRADDYVLCMTMGHKTDRPILHAILEKRLSPAYLGVIGSQAKRKVLVRELQEDGIPADLARRRGVVQAE